MNFQSSCFPSSLAPNFEGLDVAEDGVVGLVGVGLLAGGCEECEGFGEDLAVGRAGLGEVLTLWLKRKSASHQYGAADDAVGS